MSMAKLRPQANWIFVPVPSKRPGLEEVSTGPEILSRPAPAPDGEVISWTQE
ncbi:MAG: hypothetical protein QOH78_1445 [Verrucomicrobiota bacterium]